MEQYKNLGGNSGVAEYESGPNYIRVKFKDGSIYLYTYASTGLQNIEQMIRLAEIGKGLNAFINKRIKKAYERKER